MSDEAPLAVVVPMYNEQEGARACVRAVLDVLATLPGRTRLFAVDDGSRDATVAELEQVLAEGADFTLVRRPANGGYGAALASGMDAAVEQGFEWVLFMDSDLTNPPSDIPVMRREMRPGVDLVKATRYAAGGDSRAVPFKRRAPSVAGNWFARVVGGMPATDATNGFRALRASSFQGLQRTERGFAAIMEEMFWATERGLRVVEVPSTLTSRADDLRPSSFTYRPATVWPYARYPLRLAARRAASAAARRPSSERQGT